MSLPSNTFSNMLKIGIPAISETATLPLGLGFISKNTILPSSVLIASISISPCKLIILLITLMRPSIFLSDIIF